MDIRDLNMSILRQLLRVNNDAGAFATGILTNELSKEEQINFACRLVDLAIAINARTANPAGVVAEGSTVNDSDTGETRPGA